jgi:hypothetical protein
MFQSPFDKMKEVTEGHMSVSSSPCLFIVGIPIIDDSNRGSIDNNTKAMRSKSLIHNVGTKKEQEALFFS